MKYYGLDFFREHLDNLLTIIDIRENKYIIVSGVKPDIVLNNK